MTYKGTHLSRKDIEVMRDVTNIAAASMNLLPGMLITKYNASLSGQCKTEVYTTLIRDGALGGSHHKARRIAHSLKHGRPLDFSELKLSIDSLDTAISQLVENGTIEVMDEEQYEIRIATPDLTPDEEEMPGVEYIHPDLLYPVRELSSHHQHRLRLGRGAYE